MSIHLMIIVPTVARAVSANKMPRVGGQVVSITTQHGHWSAKALPKTRLEHSVKHSTDMYKRSSGFRAWKLRTLGGILFIVHVDLRI